MQGTPLELKIYPDQKFTLTGNVKAEDFHSIYQKVIAHHQKHLKLDGFRPGKVPLPLVIKNTDPQHLLEETINEVVSQLYQISLDHHHLHPVIPPQVKFAAKKFDPDKPWPVEISSCLTPKIEITKTLYSLIAKIDPKLNPKDKTEKILSTLEKSAKITLPQILLDYEFSQFESQEQLKPSASDRAEFERKITREWTINLAINQIASTEKIAVDPKELKEVIAKNPSLSQNPNLIYYLLLQQKVINFLLAKIK